MYIWQFAINGVCVVGRTWEQFTEFMTGICERLKRNEMIVCYVHNLAYEFSYLKGIYKFTSKDVFAMDNRKVLKCVMFGKIEFRCSYLHSNMSLKEFTSKMGAKHVKLSGDEFDYSVKRFPWTKLNENELAYCVYDVIGLVEALNIEMKHDGDNLYSICLTSTGYVRRDAKRCMHDVSHYWIKKQTPNEHIYELLRYAFRGGDTHANRFFAGDIVYNVHSVDRSSSYPDCLVNHLFPVSRFKEVGAITPAEYERLYGKYAIISAVRIYGARLAKHTWGIPYLPRDKCKNIKNGVYDNGRILTADMVDIVITDVDMDIIRTEYVYDKIEYYDVAYARYGKLPAPFIDLINEYYRKKTILKGDQTAVLDYFRAKQKLNSLYGMVSQSIKNSIIFNGVDFEQDETPLAELLEKDNEKRELPCYQTGVYCTAWARWELHKGIQLVDRTPGAYFIYADTDSIKYIGDVDFSGYNKERKRHSKENGAYAKDSKGKLHYMGIFEVENTAKEFKTLGAKKYCYTDETGKLHLTLSGVIKNKGAQELEKYGGISAFQPSFVFREAGGVEAIYNDIPEITEYEIDGHKINITSNVVLRESTYTLGITNEYEYLLYISHIEPDIF